MLSKIILWGIAGGLLGYGLTDSWQGYCLGAGIGLVAYVILVDWE